MTSELLIKEPPIQILPTLARELGLNEAIVIQQVHYWLNLQFSRHLIEDHYWVRYTPENWERQFSFWDLKTLQRAIKSLERLEVLIFIENNNSDKERYYTIDYWTLDQVTSPSDKAGAASSASTNEHANFDGSNGEGQ